MLPSVSRINKQLQQQQHKMIGSSSKASTFLFFRTAARVRSAVMALVYGKLIRLQSLNSIDVGEVRNTLFVYCTLHLAKILAKNPDFLFRKK